MRPATGRRSRLFRPARSANAPDPAKEDFSQIYLTGVTAAAIAALT